MPAKILSRLLIIAFILGAQVFMLPLAPVQVVQAQGETFSISTPYYGSKEIRSYFDHSAPTYTPRNNLFVKYDGHSWTGNVSISNCTNDLNCYDGHNGLDIGMAYEHVLAAADGVVTMARWNVTNCHNGVGCNYGLEV